MILDPLSNLIQKGKEFLGTVTVNHSPRDLADCNIKGRQQTGGAIAFIIVRSGYRPSGFHRQGDWVRPIAWMPGFSSTESTTT